MGERRAVAEFLNPWEQRGKELGAQEALRTALVLQLGDRFGPMSNEDLALLDSLDRARIEELVVIAERADSYDVWQTRLREVAKRK